MRHKNFPGNKKAFLFSTDALIALIIIFLTILVAYPVIKYSQHKAEIQADILEILSSLKIGEIDNSYVQDLIFQKEITDLNKTILEQIGIFYVTDTAKAQELAQSILSSFDTKENIGIWYGNQLLASLNTTPFENSKNIEVERQIISGIRSGEEITGFSARAFLSSDLQSKYFYFGGYVGDGNITSRIEYHGDITSAEMELAISNNFDVYINGYYSGNYEKSASEFSPRKYTIPSTNFNSGTNLIEIKGKNLYIAGGYIKITYSSSIQFSQPEKYYFPGIEGLINIYDGFYIPGKLNSLNLVLHLNTPYITFLSIGNKTVFRDSTNGEQTITLNNQQLSSLLDYNELTNKTIPLKLGLEDVAYETTRDIYADIFSVSPLPSSFNAVLGKVETLRNANRGFIELLLGIPVTRVGLVGIYSDIIPPDYYHNLSRDYASLNNTLNNWELKSGVCLCCGINKAVDSLVEYSSPDNFKSVVVMADDKPTAGCGGDAKQDAIDAACQAYQNHGIVFYAVALGDKWQGQDTMQQIASCTNGTYYAGELGNIGAIYQEVARDLLELIHYQQTIIVTEGDLHTKLFPDSYIEFDYQETQIPYGLMINLEKQFSDAYFGSFNIPQDSKLVEAKAISYSGPRWTDSVEINNISVYDLKSYGQAYTELGDPYAINIDPGLVQENNIVKITTGLSPLNSSQGSENNKIIYTLIKNASSYSPILAKADGCIWNIEFEDLSIISLKVPSEYSGTENCYYQTNKIEYNENDAVQTAVYNLLTSLDTNSNNKPDSKFLEQNLKISSSQITGIPYTWHTEVQIRRWD